MKLSLPPLPTTLSVAYAFLCLYTFGHSWVNYSPSFPPTLPDYNQRVEVQRAVGAVLAAVFVPFYWSIELQESEK